MTSANYAQKIPHPNTIILWVRASVYEFGAEGGHNSVHSSKLSKWSLQFFHSFLVKVLGP